MCVIQRLRLRHGCEVINILPDGHGSKLIRHDSRMQLGGHRRLALIGSDSMGSVGVDIADSRMHSVICGARGTGSICGQDGIDRGDTMVCTSRSFFG